MKWPSIDIVLAAPASILPFKFKRFFSEFVMLQLFKEISEFEILSIVTVALLGPSVLPILAAMIFIMLLGLPSVVWTTLYSYGFDLKSL